MRQTMFYGYTCIGCKNANRLGKIDIEPTAPLSELRAQLPLEDWKDGNRTCPRQECAAITYVTLDKTILLAQVEVTKEGLEYP